MLDEADRLFEGNLAPVVRELMRRMDGARVDQQRIRQTILLSATMPTALAEFASTGNGHDQLLFPMHVITLSAFKSISPHAQILLVVGVAESLRQVSTPSILQDFARIIVLFGLTLIGILARRYGLGSTT